MTRAVVARVAGATFLLYIAVRVVGSVLFEGSMLGLLGSVVPAVGMPGCWPGGGANPRRPDRPLQEAQRRRRKVRGRRRGGIDDQEASSAIRPVTLQGVTIPFASAGLLWRLKQTVRAKDQVDREFLAHLLGENQ